MAMSNLSTPARNAITDALVDLIDAGTTDTGGDLTIHTAAFATLLASPEFQDPAFGNSGASNPGEAIMNGTPTDPSAAATGTAAVIRIQDRDNTQIFDGTAGVAASDLILNTVNIVLGDQVAVTAGLITTPIAA